MSSAPNDSAFRWLILSTSPTFGKYASGPLSTLRSHGCEVVIVDAADLAKLRSLLPMAHAWIVGTEAISSDSLDLATQLKVIAKHGTGIDNIDVAAAEAKGIRVTHAAGLNREAVADMTFGLILSAARRIPLADRRVRGGEWSRTVGADGWSRCLGIIGFGQIGQAVARRARGFNMRVLAYDVSAAGFVENDLGVVRAEMHELLQQADFVSVHVPLIEGTRSLIGPHELALMKPTSFLVNTSRGGVVNERALMRALERGELAGAALDVFDGEPLSPDSEWRGFDNVVLSPHSAGYTGASLAAIGEACAANVLAVLEAPGPRTP